MEYCQVHGKPYDTDYHEGCPLCASEADDLLVTTPTMKKDFNMQLMKGPLVILVITMMIGFIDKAFSLHLSDDAYVLVGLFFLFGLTWGWWVVLRN